MNTNRDFLLPLGTLAVMALALLLAGCSDSLVSHEDETVPTTNPVVATDGAKLRHAALLDRAFKSQLLSRPSGAKDGTGTAYTASGNNQLSLIVAVPKGLQKQRVLERFKVIERFKVVERFTYDEVFNGWALAVEDNYGANDYSAFFNALNNDPDILWYEPDFDVETAPASFTNGSGSQQVPWNVAMIGGRESVAQSGNGWGTVDVDLYVLDTGVAWGNVNDPNDDFVLVENRDFRPNVNDPVDHDGHGTHVAGTAAASDDHDGLVGVAPGARVHNLKVLADDGKTDVSVVIAAVEHILAEKRANPWRPMVVNLSLGEDIGSTQYTALDEALETAIDAGIVVVVAAGNQGKDASQITPAHVDGALTVGAYDQNKRFASWSNRGAKVDLLAPGKDVVSLARGTNQPVVMSGTSMAAAHVAGAALLHLWKHPSATPAQVRQALLNKAQPFVQGVPSNTTNKSVWVAEGGTPPSGGVPTPGTVLMVVPNEWWLANQDAAKRDLMASWGFNVIAVSANADQNRINQKVSQADVVYISQEINSNDLGTKLTWAAIGIVIEEGALLDDFSMSTSTAWHQGQHLTLANTSHYITQPFAGKGSIQLFTSTQNVMGLAGNRAQGVKTLASWGSTGTLAVLDAGQPLLNYGPAAGRRVVMPWGGDNFNFTTLTSDGTTLLRRALEWAQQ